MTTSKQQAENEGFTYLAGAYRSKQGWIGVDANINVARFWAKQLADANIPMFCPHLNSAHAEDWSTANENYWLRMDLTILVHAKAIFMLPNYQLSRGAMEELKRANEWGIPDFYAQAPTGCKGLAELVTWWKGASIAVH